MKINDKPLSEVFEDIPFPLKIVVVLGTGFVFFVVFYVSYLLYIYDPPKPPAKVVRIGNLAGNAGTLDPSIATDGKHTVMAYTVVKRNNDGLFATDIRASLGMSNCLEWRVIDAAIETREETLVGPDLMTPVANGIWRAETPSLVYDPADTGREWKLFAYRYFWAENNGLARLYSAIVMRHTGDVTGRNWSYEEWVMSAAPNQPPTPYGSSIKTHINSLHEDLHDVYFYARPSVVLIDGVLVMSLSAFVQGKDAPDRIIMLVSTDHARSWRYMGTALRESDAVKIGNLTRIGGASLAVKDDVLYLAAFFADQNSGATGTYIFDFEDASRARLRRDPKTGGPAIAQFIPTVKQPPTLLGGGALAYSKGCDKYSFISESVDNRRYDIYAVPVSLGR